MEIKLINWPTSTGKVWLVWSGSHGYYPIAELPTTDIHSDLAQKALADEIAKEKPFSPL